MVLNMSFENGKVLTLRRPLMLFAPGPGPVCDFSPIVANAIVLCVLALFGAKALIISIQFSDGTFFTLAKDFSPVLLAKLQGYCEY